MMSNPDFLRQMSNPSTLQAAMQMQQAMRTLQTNGFPGITQGQMGMGGMGGLGGMGGMGGMGGSQGLDFSSLLGTGAGVGAGAFPGTAAPGTAPAPAPAVDPAARFASQLQQLRDMGFSDDAASLRVLAMTGGNVNAAVERLLGGM